MHQKIKNILDNLSIDYKVIFHADYSNLIKSPKDLAVELNYDIERITKSVLLKSKENDKYIMAVCSSNKKMDFDLIKNLVSCKRIVVASLSELNSLIGYPVAGVSPIGTVKDIDVIIDESLSVHESILIGAGVVGAEIEISPFDLLKITNGSFFSIISK